MPAVPPPFRILFFTAFALAAALSCCAVQPAVPDASLGWEPRGAFPVFQKLTTSVEDAAIGSPDVVSFRDAGGRRRFRMAYAQGGTDGKGRIGLAESEDGVTWARIAPEGKASVLEPSSGGGWDSRFIDTPALLIHQGKWYLWYFGAPSNDQPGGAIGLATSTDGITFERASDSPVLERGNPGAWDGLWVESPSVTHDGTRFVMYYTGADASWLPLMGRAVSVDGIVWVKDGENPVLRKGTDAEWDGYAKTVGDAIHHDGSWKLFYCAMSTLEAFTKSRHPKVGVATSDDGTRFSGFLDKPAVDSSFCGQALDGPYNPCVLYDDETGALMMWYETGLGFGHAVSAP